MSDPAQPEACIPPDPSVSGWWWLLESNGTKTPAFWLHLNHEWEFDGIRRTPEDLGALARILGPVLSHAEVEALREGKSECVRRLYAANAEIARLKTPDLVTVRREDLRHTLSLTCPYIDEDTSFEIDARLTAMEEVTR